MFLKCDQSLNSTFYVLIKQLSFPWHVYTWQTPFISVYCPRTLQLEMNEQAWELSRGLSPTNRQHEKEDTKRSWRWRVELLPERVSELKRTVTEKIENLTILLRGNLVDNIFWKLQQSTEKPIGVQIQVYPSTAWANPVWIESFFYMESGNMFFANDFSWHLSLSLSLLSPITSSGRAAYCSSHPETLRLSSCFGWR